MPITQNKVVNFHYRLSEAGGAVIETNQDNIPMAYLHGHGNLLPGLEAALDGKEEGDQLQVTLPPEQAYGQLRENAVQRIPIKHLVGQYKRLRPGMLIKVQTEQGIKDGSVVKAGKFMVSVDFNHPFAGKTLVFDIEIASVRDATEEELAHGHAHGTGGHQH